MSFADALDKLGALTMLRVAGAGPDGSRLCKWGVEEIIELRDAVLKYGTHTTDCRYRGGHDCTCGLDELRTRLKREKALYPDP